MLDVIAKILGGLLGFLSLISLSIALGQRDLRNFINHRVNNARVHGLILLLLLFVLTSFGVLAYLTKNRLLVLLSGISMVVGLIYFELWDIREFWKNAYKPLLKKEVVDIAMYPAVLWLLSNHVMVPIQLALLLSVIMLLTAFYYSMNLEAYIKFYRSVIVPIDIFPTYVGSRIFSLFFAAHILTYGFFELPFTLLILAGFSALAFSMFQSARRIEELKVTMKANDV